VGCVVKAAMIETDQIQASKQYKIDCGIKTLYLSERTHLMGILNITPDSFYNGGKYIQLNHAVDRAFQMVEEGTDIIDIGGESTRPGADTIPVQEELDRVIPVIEKLRGEITCPISIDTRKAEVAQSAIEAGAHLINDVSGLVYDENMVKIAVQYHVPVVLMHMRGTPQNMQNLTEYDDLILDVYSELKKVVDIAIQKGIHKDRIIVDPGIGFSKRAEDNFILLKNLHYFRRIGCPLLIGVSNKSFIGWKLNLPKDERMLGTAAAVAASVLQGAHIVRVHEIKEMRQVIRIIDQINHCTDSQNCRSRFALDKDINF
jgi:dihydropteroate synthase